MEAEFRREASLRLKVLNGEHIEDRLEPLYSMRTERIKCPWLRTQAVRKRNTAQNFIVQDQRQFRTLFKSFAGSVSHLQLPTGCFFAGSSVLACAQISSEFYRNEKLKDYLRNYDRAAESAWRLRFGILRQCGLPRCLVKQILYLCESADGAEELLSLIHI